MSNPFSLLPFAVAAAGARVAEHPAHALVAAGVTLLQRCAPLVRTLAVQPPAVLLPRGAALVTALAACDGHVALLVDANLPSAERDAELAGAPFGVLFTLRGYAQHCPQDVVTVLLDDVPGRAVVNVDGQSRVVDLGSHVGLALEGERGPAGSQEAVIRCFLHGRLVTFSHAELMRGEGPAWLGSWLEELLAGGRDSAQPAEGAS